MVFGERLTIRGKLVSAGAGLAAELWIVPFPFDIAVLFWPGDELPRSVLAVIGFACGAVGMILLSGLAWGGPGAARRGSWAISRGWLT